jgi:ADP-heptose:LPS heptosyltransferase
LRRLILRPGAIGDFLVSLPALEFLKADYTEVWTTEPNVPLVRFAGKVESLVASGIDSIGLPSYTPNPVTMRRLSEFDSIVSWYGTQREEFREAMNGLPVVFHAALPKEGFEHAVDFYLRQVGAPPGAVPRLPLPPCAMADQPFVIVHPFSGGRKKNWPLERFREAAAALGVPVQWTAGPEEELPEATRFDNLWDLAQWLRRGAVFLGNDSGISHLAAAAGVPVVALFGPTDPKVWSPRGKQVTVLRSLDGTMHGIPTADVIAAVRAYLRK